MREIKFRVWHGANYMTNQLTLLDIQNGEILSSSDTIVMQCTEMFDKNEKECYEGDIIEKAASDGKGFVRGVIFFKYGAFRIHWYDHSKGWNDVLLYHLEDSVIIGNIYENKELLSSPTSMSET